MSPWCKHSVEMLNKLWNFTLLESHSISGMVPEFWNVARIPEQFKSSGIVSDINDIVRILEYYQNPGLLTESQS